MIFSDNNIGVKLDDTRERRIFSRAEMGALLDFADKDIKTICKENENLLVFPYSIEESQDKLGDNPIFKSNYDYRQDTFTITTGNILGFIGIDGKRMKIRSRFDDSGKDYFLHYMLQKVFDFNLFDLNYDNDNEDIYDFLMFMFPRFLRNALNQGLYRQYHHFRHNDTNIKGSVDVSRHIKSNMPFLGKIAYNTREYTHDNALMQLIRHTIEYIRTKSIGEAVLASNRTIIDDVKTIINLTPTYQRKHRQRIIMENLRQVSHPFYTEYVPLQQICLKILRMEEVSYGENDDEVNGILFDGAWLWEEYVNTILRNLGFIHPENKYNRNAIFLFRDFNDVSGRYTKSGKRFPDFYKDDFILDAKYKRMENHDKVSKVDRNDIHQVISYMYNLKTSRGGFVYPIQNHKNNTCSSHLLGYGGTMTLYGIEISKAQSYKEFCLEMKKSENKFIDDINSCVR